jgi:hypothetical protein
LSALGCARWNKSLLSRPRQNHNPWGFSTTTTRADVRTCHQDTAGRLGPLTPQWPGHLRATSPRTSQQQKGKRSISSQVLHALSHLPTEALREHCSCGYGRESPGTVARAAAPIKSLGWIVFGRSVRFAAGNTLGTFTYLNCEQVGGR